MRFYLQSDSGPFLTQAVPHKVHELEWQKRGLQYTLSGYGSKIPTKYMVKIGNRWHRVYCQIYSNIGSLFVVCNGKKTLVNGEV